MSEKKLIVPLVREPKAKKSKPARNHLLLFGFDSFFCKNKGEKTNEI